ncbi:AI-2E family transporter [Candidatus Falkowbacteria bacterium]|jgi:predicted PurR-regulated permease PerM|nr:AI-2E family transporter [Candidatus Falkowbacteria bacterium]MBT4432779.1 AI-2E family transporter [Candidatus Falkowbacteria bacterium]
MSNLQKQQLNISMFSIVKILLVLFSVYLLYLVSDVVAMLFIAFILFSVINPLVNSLHSRRVPRALGTIIIYIVLFAIISSVFVLLTPVIVHQVKELIKNFPGYWEQISSGFSRLEEYSVKYSFEDNIKKGLEFLQNNIGQGAKGVFSVLSGIFGGVASFFIVLVITFYMVVEKSSVKDLLSNIVPAKPRDRITHIMEKIQEKLGLWARAQLILSFIIFLLTFVALSVAGVEYALVLALIAGLTELIPYLGPILGAIPAIVLAFFQAPHLALIVLGIYLAIQQFENIVLVPQVMKKAVGINPVVSIVALMSGFKIGAAIGIGSILGAILAIPIVITFNVIINEVFQEKK